MGVHHDRESAASGSSALEQPAIPRSRAYSKIGGTSAVVTASTTVSGATVKLTVTAITDPSANLTAGGPGGRERHAELGDQGRVREHREHGTFTTSSIRLF